ncbi:hypothetical protein JCM11641_001205 [Rhodosporidiobolus odoratus]
MTSIAAYLLSKREEGFKVATDDPANSSLYSGAGTLEEASHELYMVVPEVNIVHLAISILSLFITFFGLFSGFVKERMYVGEAIIATCFGIAFSAYGAGIFAPRTWASGHHTDELTLELTRIIIALSVFAVGVELPKAYVWRHWRSLSMLLGPIMLVGWMVAAALMYAIIPGLEFLPALVAAAAVTPTDPILASSVVGKGKYAQEHVPSHIRHILQAESGCNDGAAFPFLYLALFLLLRDHHSVGHAIGYWVLLCLLYQIVLGCIIGAAVGVAARKILKFAKRRELIDRESMVAMYVALALLVTGLTTLAGSDDLLAAFACGTAFAWDDWFTESIEESNFSSTIDLLANCAIFIYLGATMPFDAWNNEYTTLTPWRLVLLCLGILTLRRLPGMYALQWWIPDIKTRREAVFAGHFGPMGVGAIFISTLAAEKLPTPNIPPENSIDYLALIITPVTYCIVLSSILVHGLTISFFTLGRRVHSRVQSFSRTFTAQSGDTASRFGRTLSFRTRDLQTDEPSWMSRVKRATRAEDIVINRDDDGVAVPVKEGEESPESMAEKGFGLGAGGEKDARVAEEEEIEREIQEDEGFGAMFGAPSNDKVVGAGQKERLDAERERKESESDGEAAVGRGEGEGGRLEHEGDTEADVAEAGGADVEKEVEDQSDVERGRLRARRHKEEQRKEREREQDDDPPKNILASDGDDDSDSEEAKARYSAKKEKALEKVKAKGKGKGRSRTPSPVPMGPSSGRRDPRREARYCRGTRTWQEGRKIIVDHGNGEVDVIDPDASPDVARKAQKNPKRSVVTVPESAVDEETRRLRKEHGPGEHEANAVKRAAQKMIRRGTDLGAIVGLKSENLSPEEKEKRHREKLERDAWCRKERRYRDSSPQGRDFEEWVEGDKVVTERGDGTTSVRDLSPKEKAARAKKHLAALRALGHPFEALEAEFAQLTKIGSKDKTQKDAGRKQVARGDSAAAEPSRKAAGSTFLAAPQADSAAQTPSATPSLGRSSSPSPSPSPARTPALRRLTESPERDASPAPTPSLPIAGHKPSLALFHAERIEPESDEEAAPAAAAAADPPHGDFFSSRPTPVRQNTALQSMRDMLFRHNKNRDSSRPPGASRDPSPAREDSGSSAAAPSIRFATVNRPERDGNGQSSGRPLPVVGSGLAVRRVPSRKMEE